MEKFIKSKHCKASEQHTCDAAYMIKEEISNCCEDKYSIFEDIPEKFHNILNQVLNGDHDTIEKGENYQRSTILSKEYGGYIVLHEKPEVRKLLNQLYRSGWIDIW